MSDLHRNEKGVGTIERIPDEVLNQLRAEEESILSRYAPHERRIILERLNALKGVVDMVSADTTVMVFANRPGGGWYWHSQYNYIRIDVEGLLKRSFEQNRFFLAHEAAHRRLTCTNIIPKDLQGNQNFHMLFNVVEDGRINLWLQDKYPLALRGGMHDFYSEMNISKTQEHLLNQPNRVSYVQLAYGEMLRLWFSYAKQESLQPNQNLPKPVLEFIEQAIPYLKEIWQSYPVPGSEGQGWRIIEGSARKGMKVLEQSLWPLFKKLLDEDTKQRGKQKMAEQESEQQNQQKGSGQEKKDESSGQSSDSEEKKNKKNKKKDDPGSSGEGKKNKGKKKNKSSPSGGDGEKKGKQKKSKLSPEDLERMKKESGGSGDVINPDKLSEESKKKLDEAFDDLSKEEHDDLIRQSENEQEAESRDIAEQHKGKMGNAEKRRAQEEKKPQKKKKKPSPNKHAKTEGNDGTSGGARHGPPEGNGRGAGGGLPQGWIAFEDLLKSRSTAVYEKIRQENAAAIQALISKLESIFTKRQTRGESGGHRDGDDVDVDRVVEEKTSNPRQTVDPEAPIWTRPYSKEDGPRDYAFTIVLDMSGSMHGERIYEALKGLIIILEALQHFNIQVEIIGFNSRFFEIKPFDQPISKDVMAVIESCLGRVSGDTLMGKAIKDSTDRLKERTPKQKTMIVITDGDSGDHVAPSIEEARQQGIEVIGVGIGQGTKKVVSNFGESGVADVSIDRLAEVLADLIRKTIDK